MRKLVALFATAAVCALALSALSGAANSRAAGWSATLTAGAEVPKPVVKPPAAAHGSFTATLTGNKLKWKLTYGGLTGKALAAHIHVGAKGKAGNVVIALCGAKPACKSGLSGTATVTAQVKSWFAKHQLYVNVHTAKNANGEIRGQLAAS